MQMQNAMTDGPADRPPRPGPEPETSDVATVRQTDAGATWLGAVCPRCGNSIGEGSEVVLCPKCLSPNHLVCWQDHGNQCGACGTTALLVQAPPAGAPGARLTAGDETLAPAPAGEPRPPTPSMDTATAEANPAAAARATRPATSRTRPGRPAGLPPVQG
jgi:hypothetical protein